VKGGKCGRVMKNYIRTLIWIYSDRIQCDTYMLHPASCGCEGIASRAALSISPANKPFSPRPLFSCVLHIHTFLSLALALPIFLDLSPSTLRLSFSSYSLFKLLYLVIIRRAKQKSKDKSSIDKAPTEHSDVFISFLGGLLRRKGMHRDGAIAEKSGTR